jgi:hypothetical protein
MSKGTCSWLNLLAMVSSDFVTTISKEVACRREWSVLATVLMSEARTMKALPLFRTLPLPSHHLSYFRFFVNPFYLQSVQTHSVNCAKIYTLACRRGLSSVPL